MLAVTVPTVLRRPGFSGVIPWIMLPAQSMPLATVAQPVERNEVAARARKRSERFTVETFLQKPGPNAGIFVIVLPTSSVNAQKIKTPVKGHVVYYISWGGRDRTFECRVQSAVPYHLATPQKHHPILAESGSFFKSKLLDA